MTQMEKNIENLEDRLYTAPEVADILGVSLRTVYRYIKSGKIVFETRTGTGHYLFDKNAISDFLYPEKKEPKIKYEQPKLEHQPPQKPLHFTPTGAIRPLHERDILESEKVF